jgi:two-component system chemotaxis response regulator CheB
MSPTPSLNVSLTPHLEKFIEALVSSGRYQSASEVVRAGLRLLVKFEANGLLPTEPGNQNGEAARAKGGGKRPPQAADRLFRSAAATFGSRVIGVVLSGALNDGTAGVRAIKQCGGVVVAQHPTDAAYPSMPLNVMRRAEVDHVVPADEMGQLLARLSCEPAGITPPIPSEIRLEPAIAAEEVAGMAAEDKLGALSRFTCPECHGALWKIDDGNLLRYRCHVGHAFTAEAMLAMQAERAEELLWSLMRAHQERATLARRMAEQERAQKNGNNLAQQLQTKAQGYDEDAAVIRSLLRVDAIAYEEDGDERGGS